MHAVRMSVFENRLTRGRVSRDDYIEHLDVTGRGWVVDVGGRIVALGICNAQTGNIWALFVLPDFERRGFGQRLLNAMVDWLWQQGLDRIWLTTESNTRAQQFYETAGWTNAGVTEHGETRFELQRTAAQADSEHGAV